MADSNFVIKNGLVVNGAFTANATTVNAAAVTATLLTIGVTTVNATTVNVGTTTINSTNYTGTTNNSLYLGGTIANGYQTTAGLAANVATLTSNNASYLNGQLSTYYTSFPAGTRVVFQQTAAPTGWTKDTTHNNKALRIVNGSVSSGGTVGFTTAFTAARSVTGTVGGTTLSWNQMPYHEHTGYTDVQGYHGHNVRINGNAQILGTSLDAGGGGSGTVASWTAHGGVYYGDINADGAGSHQHNIQTYGAGGGWSHDHSFSGYTNLDVQYVDVIIAQKD